jgi:hypothetical protein
MRSPWPTLTVDLTLALTVAVMGLLLSSCGSSYMQSPEVTRINPKTGKVETTTAVKQIEPGIVKSFPDIPIPASHKIDLEKSVIFASPSQTVGKLVTTGRGDAASLFAFYTTHMADAGWKLVNSFQSATSSLYFAKPGKFAAIIIESQGRSATVTINIGPE